MMVPFRQAAFEALLAGLFLPGVAVGVIKIGAAGPLMTGEEPAVVGAVPARVAEFAAGRTAARRAMAALGHPAVAIPAGAGRAPVWPEGLAGSIAHSGGIAAAVLRRGAAPLGLDLEPDTPLEPDLWPLICDAAELANLPVPDRGRDIRRVFSAKEAVYKAQFPLTGQVIGFDAVSVTLRGGSFEARFRHAVGPLPAGHRMAGRMARAGGLILSGVAA